MQDYKADAKKKGKSNIIDEKAINLIKVMVPEYWTCRDYKPDFGIDLAIETFDDETLETLGEHFFVQVKGTEKITKRKLTIHGKKETFKRDVITFSLETDLLVTVQRMGHACPVMLFVVDVINKIIYFININDYIDKFLLRSNKDYTLQKTVTVYIPDENQIKTKDDFWPLFIYSKRAKFYAFFETVRTQKSNLDYICTFEEYKETTKVYAEILLSFDIINSKKSEHYFFGNKRTLQDIKNNCSDFLEKNKRYDNKEKKWEINHFCGEYTELELHLYIYIKRLWEDLCTLQAIYEDNWREYYLPTELDSIMR